MASPYYRLRRGESTMPNDSRSSVRSMPTAFPFPRVAMLFSSRLSLSSLIELCRVLRHYLASGLSLRDVFLQQAQKGPGALRPIAGRIAQELERGTSLEDALKPEAAAFPPLFLALAGVGEQTGMLPEVFGELEKYFTRQQL